MKACTFFCLSKKEENRKKERILSESWTLTSFMVWTAPRFVHWCVLTISRSWGYLVHVRYNS